jgi:hypothetical protein
MMIVRLVVITLSLLVGSIGELWAEGLAPISDEELKEVWSFPTFSKKSKKSRYRSKTPKKSALSEYNFEQLNRKMQNQGSSLFAFNYIADGYSVTSPNSNFKKIFEQSTGAMRAGYLEISNARFLYRGWVDFAWGGSLSAAFSQGKGEFSSGNQSETQFTLWTVPLEPYMMMEIPIGSWFKLGASAGPSVVALFQTRNDMDSGEKYKRRRQLGWGYFATLVFKTDIGAISPERGFYYFSQYGISRFHLDLLAKFRNYSNFQDQITISGVSWGLGFSFEFL